jgi:hypothetical protein
MRLSILASIFVASSIAAAAHAAGPAAADVGDADSFGRNVHFIGTSQSGAVTVTSDASNCPPPDPSLPDDRCLVVNPAPAQTVATFNDIGRIKLPAKATNSLLCHAVTPFFFWHASNPTGSPASTTFAATVSFTIENQLLDDPSLIDPTTGLPFGGKLDVGLTGLTGDTHTLQPGDSETRRHVSTKFCLGGLVSKDALVFTYGLSAAQADDFFRKPMTVHLNLTLRTLLVDDATAFYAVRLFGD